MGLQFNMAQLRAQIQIEIMEQALSDLQSGVDNETNMIITEEVEKAEKAIKMIEAIAGIPGFEKENKTF